MKALSTFPVPQSCIVCPMATKTVITIERGCENYFWVCVRSMKHINPVLVNEERADFCELLIVSDVVAEAIHEFSKEKVSDNANEAI